MRGMRGAGRAHEWMAGRGYHPRGYRPPEWYGRHGMGRGGLRLMLLKMLHGVPVERLTEYDGGMRERGEAARPASLSTSVGQSRSTDFAPMGEELCDRNCRACANAVCLRTGRARNRR